MAEVPGTDVLFITIDSLRADHLGCYGYHRETTPRIDAIAEGSHRFQNAFSHACQTPYSFPSIMTSTYAMMYGGGQRLSSQRVLVSEVLDRAGYATAGFHSNPYLSADFGYERGYDVYFDSFEDRSWLSSLRQTAKNRLDTSGRLFRILKTLFDKSERQVGIELGSPFVRGEELTDMAIDWAAEVADREHRYLWIHYMDVHHPYSPPPEHQSTFRDDPINERSSVKLRRKMLESPDELTDGERQAIVDLYDAEVLYTDEQIGRLVSEIRGRWGDDVLVVLTADHGDELNDHGGYSHHVPKFFDEYIHVPLILSAGNGSGTYDDIVGLMDVPPTIADYATGQVPDPYLGASLRRLIDGKGWERKFVIAEWEKNDEYRNFCCRDAEWKYVYREDVPSYEDHTFDGDRELYHLAADPGETTNVVDDFPDQEEEFRREIEAHIKRIEATGSDREAVEVDEGVRQRLRDLGYQE